jgi:hypothetical protein
LFQALSGFFETLIKTWSPKIYSTFTSHNSHRMRRRHAFEVEYTSDSDSNNEE